ncbi:MAG: protein-disulfide isomerase [Nitrosopumilaceae archaeon]
MGRKVRKEREEKRDSFAAKRSKEKRKNSLIAIAVLSGIGVIVGISAYNFVNLDQSAAVGGPPNAGILGSEHVHASLLTKLHGDTFDYSSPAYQIKSSWIHFEAQDGSTIHRHATGVTLGYLFDTIGIGLDDKCFTFQGTNGERVFCSNEDYSLKFFVNHQPVQELNDYVFKDGDRILISYGGETQEQIDSQLAELDAQPILA